MPPGSTRESKLHLVFCAALALGFALAFWIPGARAADGEWPAPLDDVFIHFDFARSLALGYPFEWIPGQGYSSGETAPLWALALAPGWLLGFRGLWLGAWAGALSAASVAYAMRALRGLRAKPAVTWIAGALLLSVGVLDWILFSGMEIALFSAVLVALVVTVDRATVAGPRAREKLQWRAGILGALLVWCRPESALIIAPLAVCAARAARSRPALPALLRASLPGAAATLAILALNRHFTGEAASAGALLKLLSSNPYYSDTDRARELALNVLHFWWKVVETHMTITPKLWWPLFALAGASLLHARTRALGLSLFSAAFLWIALVSWNGAARYQNFRYYMPAILIVLVCCALGLRALWDRARPIGIALAAAGGLSALARVPAQIQHFAACAENIHHQQVTLARALPAVRPARVLLGDAGAIPYVSGVSAIDALGLGGFAGLPWARAATQGEAATVELIQSLPPSERPSHLVLYPNWFRAITSSFGRELSRVTLARNVICGGPVKAIYAADWGALDVEDLPAGEITDELDIADVRSERAHAYESPAPLGGFTRVLVLPSSSGAPMFDGGRAILPGHPESFRARASGASVVLRVAEPAARARANGAEMRAERRGGWTLLRAELALREGDRVTIEPEGGPITDAHVYLTR